jgi:hypothetical protein
LRLALGISLEVGFWNLEFPFGRWPKIHPLTK